MSNSTVIVRPVVKKKPWVNTAKFEKNKLQGANTTLVPYLDEEGLKTGLTSEQEREFEKKLNLPEKTLLNTRHNAFWDDFSILLQDEPNVFHKNIPREELKIAVLRAHPMVANTQDDISPDTDFYIEDLEAELEDKAKAVESKEEAYKIFSKLSAKGKRDILKLYGKGGDTVTDSVIKTTLSTEMEDNPSKFISTTNFSKDIITTRAFIFDLVDYGIMRTRGSSYFDGDNNMGEITSFTDYLLMPDKQDVYLMYKDRLSQAKIGS